MENKHKLTFSQIWEIGNSSSLRRSTVEDNVFLSSVFYELKRADRGYTRSGSEGNYLRDFLKNFGEQEASPIIFVPGSPHCAGEGIKFLDVAKLRRQAEDSLRKLSSYESFYAAVKGSVNLINPKNAVIWD